MGLVNFHLKKYCRNRFLFFSLFCFLFFSCNENIESHFSDYKELEESGYLSNGWIPKILPSNSFEIKETHNLDNNHVFGTFKYRSDIIDSLINSLEIVNINELEKLLHEINFPKRPKWFIDYEKTNDKKLKFHRFENFILIVNREERTVYFVH